MSKSDRSVISDEQRAALSQLATLMPEGAYLAGGVAVAAELQHRSSRDLDFFVPSDFDPAMLAERLSSGLRDLRVTNTAPGTLYLELQGVPASVIVYRYPLLHHAQKHPDLGVPVASLEDLACMKLSAIASRGMARDFWDLHALLEHGVADGRLGDALEMYRRKYASGDTGHVVRSLVYFGDADAQPLPRGLTADEWQAIKRDFAQWVKRL